MRTMMVLMALAILFGGCSAAQLQQAADAAKESRERRERRELVQDLKQTIKKAHRFRLH